MPSTYDPLLRLELQATGENATTWGIKTNTNLELLADSVAGAVNLNVAGSGDYTLSTANGADDEARQAILVLTGTLTGDRNIIVPASPKTYTVINNTTGAFTVTLKQAASTGVVIPQGSAIIAACTSVTVVDSVGATTFGRSLITTTSAAPARTLLGATAVGSSLFTVADTSVARSTLGATTVGNALFIAVDTSAARATLGATTTGAAVLTASDQAAARTAIVAAPLPNASSGAGLWTVIDPGVGANAVLAAGGTWAYLVFVHNGAGEITAVAASLAAGGTTIAVPGGGDFARGFAWRIA